MRFLNGHTEISLGIVGIAIVVYAFIGIVRRRLIIFGQRNVYTGSEAIRNGIFWAIFGLAFVAAAVYSYWNGG
jgi:uncharacterized membrane protein